MLTERINKFQQDLITKFDTIMAASILQGVVAPCFLKKWVYDFMFLGLSAELEPSVDDIKRIPCTLTILYSTNVAEITL